MRININLFNFLTQECWAENPSLRPTFGKLLKISKLMILDEILRRIEQIQNPNLREDFSPNLSGKLINPTPMALTVNFQEVEIEVNLYLIFYLLILSQTKQSYKWQIEPKEIEFLEEVISLFN